MGLGFAENFLSGALGQFQIDQAAFFRVLGLTSATMHKRACVENTLMKSSTLFFTNGARISFLPSPQPRRSERLHLHQNGTPVSRPILEALSGLLWDGDGGRLSELHCCVPRGPSHRLYVEAWALFLRLWREWVQSGRWRCCGHCPYPSSGPSAYGVFWFRWPCADAFPSYDEPRAGG